MEVERRERERKLEKEKSKGRKDCVVRSDSIQNKKIQWNFTLGHFNYSFAPNEPTIVKTDCKPYTKACNGVNRRQNY